MTTARTGVESIVVMRRIPFVDSTERSVLCVGRERPLALSTAATAMTSISAFDTLCAADSRK
jgi:hypothetical protein